MIWLMYKKAADKSREHNRLDEQAIELDFGCSFQKCLRPVGLSSHLSGTFESRKWIPK